jgi:hypothetical protein
LAVNGRNGHWYRRNKNKKKGGVREKNARGGRGGRKGKDARERERESRREREMADEKEKKKKCRELAVTPVDDFHWHSDGNSRGLLYAFFRFAERNLISSSSKYIYIWKIMENC